MIISHVGVPGAGKSYDTVARLIYPALKEKRLVVTNIPINMREMRIACGENIDPFLIQLTQDNCAGREGDTPMEAPIPFADVRDFTNHDKWRSHGTWGQGPLFVVDECHECFADCVGLHASKHPVVQWFATHRKTASDVVVITQRVNDIPAAIRGRVEEHHEFRRKGLLGFNRSYKRIVYDKNLQRIPGAEADGSYDPAMCKLYKSTQVGAVETRFRQRPIWFQTKFYIAAAAVVLAVLWVSTHEIKLPGVPNGKAKEKAGNAVASVASAPGGAHDGQQGDGPVVQRNADAEVLAGLDAKIARIRKERELKALEDGCEVGEMQKGLVTAFAGSLPAGVSRCPGGEAAGGYRHRFDKVSVKITGHMAAFGRQVYWLKLARDGRSWDAKDDDLQPFGFDTMAVGPCLMFLKGGHGTYRVTCDGFNVIEDAEKPAQDPVRVLEHTGDAVDLTKKPVTASE